MEWGIRDRNPALGGIDTYQGSKPQPPSVPCGFETSWDRTLSRSVGSKPRGSVGSTPIRDRTPGTGCLGTTTFGIDTLRAVLWITGNSGIETPGNPGVGFEPYGSKPRSRVRTPSGSKPQESGSNPRDRNPRSRVRTLGIETHESGSNPIGIETQEGSNPRDRNPRVGFEP